MNENKEQKSLNDESQVDWCSECNIEILNSQTCPECGSSSDE